MDGDVGDATGHECRPDAAHFQAFERGLIEAGFGIFFLRESRNANEYSGKRRKEMISHGDLFELFGLTLAAEPALI
jgi:hypothetical protein